MAAMSDSPDKKAPKQPSCEQLINSYPDPYVVIDRDYKIVMANRQYAAHYGSRPEDIQGKHCFEVSHKTDKPCSEHGEHCPLEELFRTGEPTQVLHVHYDCEGCEEHVQINATPLFDQAGQLQFMGETIVPLKSPATDSPLIGSSNSMQMLLQQVQRVAPTRTMILLLGESGTGKECIAQYIHSHSGREDKPLVVVDCAALPSAEVERELFGLEGNAGEAGTPVLGVFEQAHGGTLLLDEIGELPLSAQTRLLRVLETGQLKRIGGNSYRNVDVRVLVASNSDLNAMVKQGRFRKDLYYRLTAFPVHIPTLRERGGDLIQLAEHFLQQSDMESSELTLSEEVKVALLRHNYPGNVRELRNLIERALVYAAGDPLRPEHLVFDYQLFASDADTVVPNYLQEDEPVVESIDPVSERHALINRRSKKPSDEEVLRVLKECGGHRSEAAQKLGVSERTLYRHLQRLRASE